MTVSDSSQSPVHLRRMSGIAFLLGMSGIIPFLFCGLMSLATLDPAAGHWVSILAAYGAVVLSFIGAVQWGLAMADPDARSERSRLILGVVPALFGWSAMLMNVFGLAELSLLVLIGGYVVTIGGEDRASRQGFLPGGYISMRWLLTLLVIAVLTTVLVLRTLGARVIYI